MTRTFISKDDLEFVRDVISNAISALENEYVYLEKNPEPTDSDLEAIELMELAAADLACVDALLEACAERALGMLLN